MSSKGKRISRKKALELADRAYSLYIRNRDDWTCICCGIRMENDKNMNNGHLISRRKMAVRFDDDNCYAQCWGCNSSHRYWPEKMTLKVIQKIGHDRYEALCKRAEETRQYKVYELLEIAEKYATH